jgi:hypothetical protein
MQGASQRGADFLSFADVCLYSRRLAAFSSTLQILFDR